MNLVRTARLDPSEEDRKRLLALMHHFNEAADWLSRLAFEEKIWPWLSLRKRAYYELRSRFDLTSQQAVAVVRKVAAAYKDRKRRSKVARFHPLGGIPVICHAYKRDRTIRFYGMRVPFTCNAELSSKKEAKLIVRGEKILLQQVMEVEEPEASFPTDWLGVDLGIVNLAVDSDGETFSGKQTNGLRRRHNRLRSRLQSKGTKSAKRLLKKRRHKEGRFASNVNHIISKKLVTKAYGSGRGIALENLKGIRTRIKATKAQRGRLHSWGFAQLRTFIEYKARLVGVAVTTVNPAYTSQTRPRCGLIDKKNRKTRDNFECVGCGFAGPADAIAAENIRRVAGNRPNVAA